MSSKPGSPSEVERHQARQYLREFVPGLVGYGLALLLAIIFGDTAGEISWRLLWWLGPLVFVGLVIRAVVRALRRSDEYQRQISLEGMAVGFAASMFAALTFGLLGVQIELPAGAAVWGVFVIGILSWGVAVTVRPTR